MAVVTVATFAPAPGKNAEAQDLLKEYLAIVRGNHGVKGHLTSVVSGGPIGSLGVALEYADAAAYGATLDKTLADKDLQKFIKHAQEAKAATPVASAVYTELPGLEVPYAEIASATVITATSFKIHPGKQAQSLERIKRSKTLLEKHGAKTRAYQSIVSDPFGVTATVTYYPNFTAYGKAGAALTADPEWQAFVAEITGASASADFLRNVVLHVV